MSTVAALGSLAGGVGSLAGLGMASNSFKSGQSQRNALIGNLGGFSPQQVFGSVPEPTDYNTVWDNPGYGGVQQRTIEDNLANLPAIQDLTGQTNAGITQQSLARINSIIPGFMSGLTKAYGAADNMLGGNLPSDVENQIRAKNAEVTGATGTPGTGTGSLLRSLGLNSLDMVSRGMSMLGGVNDIAGSLDPISRHMLPQSMFLNPADNVKNLIGERGLQYEAAVNNALLAAAPDPAAAGQFGLQMAGTGGQMNPFAAQQPMAFGNALSSIASGFGGLFGNSNPFASQGGNIFAPPTAKPASYFSGNGYNLDYAPTA